MPSKVRSTAPLTRRQLLLGAALAPVSLLWPSPGSGTPAPTLRTDDDRPDILILVVDSLRAASTPMYGHPRPTTPYLAELARGSTLYRRCYSCATWTRPAVTSILSGRSLLEHGQWGFDKRYPEHLPSLPRALGARGYRTAYFTANYAIGTGYGMEEHFDHVNLEAARHSDFGPRLTDEFMAWLDGGGGDETRPLFGYVHYFPPHGPYLPPPEHREAVRRMVPKSAVGQREVEISLHAPAPGRIPWYQAVPSFSRAPDDYHSAYEANVLYADSLLADFMERWKRRRGHRRTVFILTSDHGESLHRNEQWFDHGRLLSNEILHVPLLIFDSSRPRRREVAPPVSHLDLVPTVKALAGVRDDSDGEGRDLLAPELPRRMVISHVGMDEFESGWAATLGRWRLVYNDRPRDGLGVIVQTHAGDAPGAEAHPLPLPRPDTRSLTPLRLAPGITLEDLHGSSEYLVRGRTTRWSMTVAGVSPERPGRLALRLRLGAQEPRAVATETGPEAGRYRAELAGSLLRGSTGDPDPAEVATLEVAWRTPGDRDRWVPVVRAPILHPRRVAEGLLLLGTRVSSPVVRAGEPVRITHVWEVDGLVPAHYGVITRLRDDAGHVLVQRHNAFFQALQPDAVTHRPIVEAWRLKGHPFEGHRLRFEESRWISLPEGARPAVYRVEAGTLDLRSLRTSPGVTLLPPGGPHVTARLEVVGSTVEAFERLLDGGAPASALRYQVSPELKRAMTAEGGAELARRVESWVRALPHWGQLHYLLATRAQGGARYRLLRRTLEETPHHVEALREMADADTAAPPTVLSRRLRREARLTLRTLKPPQLLDWRIADLAELYGFRLERSRGARERLDLTLYWRALTSSCVPLSTYLSIRTEGDAEDDERDLWWLVGGVRRPSTRWTPGEAVVETVRLPDLEHGKKFKIGLAFGQQAVSNYDREESRVLLPLRTGAEGLDSGAALLGEFDPADLPRSSGDPLRHKRIAKSSYQLYDLETDPEEASNLVEKRPRVFAGMRSNLLARLEYQDGRAEPIQGRDSDLNEEDKRRLRALGYVVG